MNCLLGCLLVLGVPLGARSQNDAGPADTARPRQHPRYLTTTPLARDYRHPAALDTVAACIGREPRAAGARDGTSQLTDTACYRTRGYHLASDMADRLDPRRLALAVDALFVTVLAGDSR